MDVQIEWSFFEDEAHLVPPGISTPVLQIPDLALVPLAGDVVFISPRSAWVVVQRVFQQMTPESLRLQIWLGHHPQALAFRRPQPLRAVPAASPAENPPE